jgi:hypothetical protein
MIISRPMIIWGRQLAWAPASKSPGDHPPPFDPLRVFREPHRNADIVKTTGHLSDPLKQQLNDCLKAALELP